MSCLCPLLERWRIRKPFAEELGLDGQSLSWRALLRNRLAPGHRLAEKQALAAFSRNSNNSAIPQARLKPKLGFPRMN